MIEIPEALEIGNPHQARWIPVTVILDIGASYGYRKGETCYVSSKPMSNGKYLVFTGYRKAHWHFYPPEEISRFVSSKRTQSGQVIIANEEKINYEFMRSVEIRYSND